MPFQFDAIQWSAQKQKQPFDGVAPINGRERM